MTLLYNICYIFASDNKVTDATQIIYFHVNGAQTTELYNAYLNNGDHVLHNVPRELPESCFDRFSAAMNSDDRFYEQSRIIYYLLTEILRLRNVETQTKYPKVIDRILGAMRNCPPKTPAEIAKQFGYNQIYLERLFKKYVGESMQSFFLRQKYSFACRFLVDTDMSVLEVAQKVGYNDSKGLILLFSKFGDLTPLAYRKKMRERPTTSTIDE